MQDLIITSLETSQLSSPKPLSFYCSNNNPAHHLCLSTFHSQKYPSFLCGYPQCQCTKLQHPFCSFVNAGLFVKSFMAQRSGLLDRVNLVVSDDLSRMLIKRRQFDEGFDNHKSFSVKQGTLQLQTGDSCEITVEKRLEKMQEEKAEQLNKLKPRLSKRQFNLKSPGLKIFTSCKPQIKLITSIPKKSNNRINTKRQQQWLITFASFQ